jgi:hypothetical protein
MGDYVYPKQMVIALLNMSARGDASLILARHLAAAKLNVANGVDWRGYARAAELSDYLMGAYDDRLPLRVRVWSPIGHWFVISAIRLHLYHHAC